MRLGQIGEFGLIERLKKILPEPKAIVRGIGDDAAVLPFNKDKYLLLTTDMMAQDVHFRVSMNPKQIGHKALACNISDIAAMGGYPTYAVVSIALPKDLRVDFVRDIYKGIKNLACRFHVHIVGGDTIKHDKLVINIALLGEVEKKYLVRRDQAKAKDWIFVTGSLGMSFQTGHHLTFIPRLEQARFLVKHFKPSAMMDISDGLAGDLNHLLRQSRLGAKLDYELIPRKPNASLKQALSDGEDYELLFTLPGAKARALMSWQHKNRSCFFYPIGRITSDPKQSIPARAYAHF